GRGATRLADARGRDAAQRTGQAVHVGVAGHLRLNQGAGSHATVTVGLRVGLHGAAAVPGVAALRLCGVGVARAVGDAQAGQRRVVHLDRERDRDTGHVARQHTVGAVGQQRTAAVRLDLAGVVAGLADAAEHRRVVVDLDRRGALRGDDVAGQRTAGAVGGRVATGLDVLRGAVAAGGGVAADAAGVVGDLDRQHVVDVDHVARQRAAGTVGDDALAALVGLLAVAAGHLGVAEQRDRVVGDLDRHDDVEAAAVTAAHLTLGGRLAAGGLLRFRGSLLRLGRRSVGRLLLHRFGRLGGLLGRLLHALGAGELGSVQLGRCALELVGDR